MYWISWKRICVLISQFALSQVRCGAFSENWNPNRKETPSLPHTGGGSDDAGWESQWGSAVFSLHGLSASSPCEKWTTWSYAEKRHLAAMRMCLQTLNSSNFPPGPFSTSLTKECSEHLGEHSAKMTFLLFAAVCVCLSLWHKALAFLFFPFGLPLLSSQVNLVMERALLQCQTLDKKRQARRWSEGDNL